jgi:hypothetical protein
VAGYLARCNIAVVAQRDTACPTQQRGALVVSERGRKKEGREKSRVLPLYLRDGRISFCQLRKKFRERKYAGV